MAVDAAVRQTLALGDLVAVVQLAGFVGQRHGSDTVDGGRYGEAVAGRAVFRAAIKRLGQHATV